MDRKLIEYKKLKFSYNPEFSNKGFFIPYSAYYEGLPNVRIVYRFSMF